MRTKANCLWMAPEYSSIGILSVGRVAWGREDRLAAGAQNPGAGGIAMSPLAGMCPAWSAYRAGRGALLPTRHSCLRNVERNPGGAEVSVTCKDKKAILRRDTFWEKWALETEERNDSIDQGFAEKGLGQVQPMRGSAATLVLGCGPSRTRL